MISVTVFFLLVSLFSRYKIFVSVFSLILGLTKFTITRILPSVSITENSTVEDMDTTVPEVPSNNRNRNEQPSEFAPNQSCIVGVIRPAYCL